jgi:Protein of unknown function (DUF4235)
LWSRRSRPLQPENHLDSANARDASLRRFVPARSGIQGNNVRQAIHRTIGVVAKLFYRPIGLAFGIVGGILAGRFFKQLWKLFSDKEETPKAKESEYGWRELLPAALLEGAIFGLVKAAVDRGGARAFERLTGTWPGD